MTFDQEFGFAVTVVGWLVLVVSPHVPSWMLWYPQLGRYVSRTTMAVISTIVLAVEVLTLFR